MYYYGVLAPGHKDLSGFVTFLKSFSGERHHAVVEESLDQGEGSLARFLAISRDLAGEEWAGALLSPVAAGPPLDGGDLEVDPAPTKLEASPVAAAIEPGEDSREEATQEPEPE